MPARPPPSIVMLQMVMRPSIESASIAGPAYSTTWPAAPSTPIWPIVAEDQVLGGDAEAELALVADPHRLRLALDQALRGEHVLDLARADAERQRAEGAVGGGVGVAADDRHARLGDAELGPDDVHDALVLGAQRVDRDAELRAVALERLDLHAAELVLDPRGDRRAVGRHVVVGGRERAVGPADRAAGEPQAVERLRARDLVDEVQVDVEQAGGDLVGVPDLVEQRAWAWCVLAPAQARRDDGQQHRLAGSGVLEVVGQVGVEGHAVAGRRARGARRRCRSTTVPRSTTRDLAAAGLVHRRVAGAAGRRRRARARGGRARRAGRAAAAVRIS